MLPDADESQTSLIIRTIIQPLSLSKPTSDGNALLDVILSQAHPTLERELTRQPLPLTIQQTFSYLHVARTITSQHPAAQAPQLLTFYCERLIAPEVLAKLSSDAQRKVLQYISDAIQTCQNNNQANQENGNSGLTGASVALINVGTLTLRISLLLST